MGQETLVRQPEHQDSGSPEISKITAQVDSFRSTHSGDDSQDEKKTDLDRSSAWGRLRAEYGQDSSDNTQ